MYVRLAFCRNMFCYPCSQFPHMLNRIEEHIFGHGRRESFGYPIERTGIVAPDVSFGVAPTYLDNRHDLNVIPCHSSANTLRVRENSGGKSGRAANHEVGAASQASSFSSVRICGRWGSRNGHFGAAASLVGRFQTDTKGEPAGVFSLTFAKQLSLCRR